MFLKDPCTVSPVRPHTSSCSPSWSRPQTSARLRSESRRDPALLQLVEELGKARMASLGPPRKGSFWGNVGSKPGLVDKRRQELQDWLFALIRDPVIAHSRMLNTFLELADAARFVQRWAVFLGCGPGGSQALCRGGLCLWDAGGSQTPLVVWLGQSGRIDWLCSGPQSRPLPDRSAPSWSLQLQPRCAFATKLFHFQSST